MFSFRRLHQLIQYRYDTASDDSSSYTDTTYSRGAYSSERSDSIQPLPYIPRARFYRRGAGLDDRYSDAPSGVNSPDVRNMYNENFSFGGQAGAAGSDGNVQYRWDFDVDRTDTGSFQIRRPRILLDSPYPESSAPSTTSVSIIRFHFLVWDYRIEFFPLLHLVSLP